MCLRSHQSHQRPRIRLDAARLSRSSAQTGELKQQNKLKKRRQMPLFCIEVLISYIKVEVEME